MEKLVKVYRVLSNFGQTEYSFCKTLSEALKAIDKAVSRQIDLGSALSVESIRDSFSYDLILETQETADYFLNQ